MIHADCLAQVTALLTTARAQLITQAEAAESQRHTRVHGRVLRNQAAGMGAAVALLRDSAKEQATG